MTIDFHVPPEEQRRGGLDLAIQSLQDYLENRHIRVRTNPAPDEPASTDGPRVAHFHGLWQPAFPRLSARYRQLGVAYAVSPHGMLEPWAWNHKAWKKRPYYYLWERPHLSGAGAVLATSELEAAHLARFAPAQKIATIPLGLPSGPGPDYQAARQRTGWKEDELIFLFLSRIHPKKGLDLLLRALHGLSSRLPALWRLAIVGDGDASYLADCRRYTDSHPELAPHVTWHGAVWGAARWDFFQGADLFCLPSHSENFGLAILEACQTGTRVLTTPQTPWSLLSDWNAAFLAEPTVTSIKQTLSGFLSSRAWSEDQRTDLARRIRERFDWSAIGPRYIALYENLAQRHPAIKN